MDETKTLEEELISAAKELNSEKAIALLANLSNQDLEEIHQISHRLVEICHHEMTERSFKVMSEMFPWFRSPEEEEGV